MTDTRDANYSHPHAALQTCELSHIEGHIQNEHVLSIHHIGWRSVWKEEAVDESSDLGGEAQKRRNIL
jgi:hypothetical protein